MKIASYLLVILLLLVPVSSLAEPTVDLDERAVINAALTHAFSEMFPYVEEAVVGQATVPLPLLAVDSTPDSLEKDYEERNQEVLLMTDVPLSARLSLVDVGSFGEPFWETYRARFGSAWLVRVSRPGIEQGMALVRLDVARADAVDASGTRIPAGTEYVLHRSGAGWSVVSATSKPRPQVP